MNLDRRNFLGTAIGILTSTNRLFLAVEVSLPQKPAISEYDRLKRHLRLLEIDQKSVMKCQLYAIFEEDLRIWFPPLEKVTRSLESLNFEAQVEPLRIVRDAILIGAGLVDDKGDFVRESKVELTPMRNGDTLALRMSFGLKIP